MGKLVTNVGRQFGLWTLAVIGGLTLVALTLAAFNFKVASPGNSAEYWEYLCGVQLPGFTGHHKYSRYGGLYPSVDGLLFYYDQRHHDELVFALPVADALRDVSLVHALLQDQNPPSAALCPERYGSVCELYDRSKQRREACLRGLTGAQPSLATALELDGLRRTVEQSTNAGSHYDQRALAFQERLHRGDQIWITLTFEAIYLLGWLLFLIWPLLLSSRLSWHWHVGLSPFLLFLPYFLGYAPMTFTFGPSGGFVYPGVLIVASLPMSLVPCTAADGFVRDQLPNVLGWLSQMPGRPLAWSQMSCIEPVSSLTLGAVLVGFAAAILYFHRRQVR